MAVSFNQTVFDMLGLVDFLSAGAAFGDLIAI